MKPGDYEHVRLILRGRAASGITQADVQRRAREISLRRTGSEAYTAEDIERAERELWVGDPTSMPEDDAGEDFSPHGTGELYDAIDRDEGFTPPARAHPRRKRSSH